MRRYLLAALLGFIAFAIQPSVPTPHVGHGYVVVHEHYSALSLGTPASAQRMQYERPWTPYDLGTKLKAWWVASDAGLMTFSGSVVQTWNDRVAGLQLGLTASCAAGATFGGTSFNSAYPGLTFDGSTNCYTAATTNLPTGATAGNIIAVLAINAAGAVNGRFIGYGDTGSNIRQVFNGTVGIARLGDGTGNINCTAATNFTAQVVVGEWVGTSENCWANGTAAAGNPLTIPSINTGTTRVRFGASVANTPGAFGQAVIAEGMVTTDLTDPERQKVEGYEAWTYGFQASLPANHPYRYQRPTNTANP